MTRMRSYARVIVAGSMAGQAMVSAQEAAAPRQEPRVRTIQMNGEPLPSRLRPDDEVVIIGREYGLPIVFESDVPPRKAVELASQVARGIVVFAAERSAGQLVEDDRWIATFTSGTIVEVVRPAPEVPLKPGAQLTLMENAGELQIAGKTVQAGPPVLQPFLAGQRYLVTMTFDPEKGRAYPTGRWLVKEDGTLQDTVLGGKGTDWRQAMTGLPLQGVVDTLRTLGPKHKVR